MGLTFGLCPPVDARFVIGSASYSFHGLTFGADAAPFIDTQTGRTMLPLRIMGEIFHATVKWDGTTNTALLTNHIGQGSLNIYVQVGEELPNNMGQAMIVDGRVFVPARFVAEMLGATIEWDADAQAVYISRPEIPFN